MRTLRMLLTTAALAALAACSGGSDDTLTGSPQPPGGGGAVDVATLTLLTSSPQIPSDGATTATITALVRDANNNVMEGVPVVFQASSGSLAVSQPNTTDANGIVTAVLSTAGNPANRPITVAGTAGDAQASVTINVIGTTLTLNCPPSLPLNDTGPCNVVLQNAAGTGIANQQVTVASSSGNSLSATTLTTDATGGAAFSVTATSSGLDTITVSALGLDATDTISVSSDVFAFTTPAAGTEIPLGQNMQLVVNWQTGGVPNSNQTVNFSTTRGALNPANGSVTTDGSGNATLTISSTNAGPAVITATNAAGTSTQLAIEFVATTAATLELQAAPFTVPTSGQSALTAVVRDAAGNLVKNKTVVFQLDDVTGGSLTVGQAVTNSQGRAQSFYNASTTTSASDGVKVTAFVQDTPTATDQVSLTVAQRELFISIGTGNEIEEPNTAQYRKEWVVQVTDSQGAGVNGATLSLSVHSVRYWEGVRAYVDPPGQWMTRPGTEALPVQGCLDEDANRNGILDPLEDANGNGRIEAGNIVTAVAQGGGTTITTDQNGFALIDVFYPQEFAYWLEVTLEARAAVQGTEYAALTTFVLPGLASDFASEDISPPGVSSPFGTDGICGTPPPPDGP